MPTVRPKERDALARIESASKAVWSELEVLGRTARGAWPEGKAFSPFTGYSYAIPKEEQIRCAFYRELMKPGDLAIELEWRQWISKGGRAKTAGEIDMVAFPTGSGPVLGLELKRAWSLPGWIDDRKRNQQLITEDLRKLGQMRRSLPDGSEAVLGLIVGLFADSPGALTALEGRVLRPRRSCLPWPLFAEKTRPLCSYLDLHDRAHDVYAAFHMLELR